MGWAINIGTGSNLLELDANIKFDVAIRKEINEGGRVGAVDWILNIEGEVVEATAETIADEIVALTQELSDKHVAVRVQIERDGTNEWDLKPEDGFWGPFVTEFRSIPDDGAGDSHWGYAMTIQFRQKGGSQQGGEENLDELHTSITVTKKNGKVIRKVWEAAGKGKNAASVHARVLTFKPSEKFVTEEIKRFFTEARVTAVWVWDAQVKAGILEIREEPIEISGGERDYEADPQAGKDVAPILHLRRREPYMIVIRGVVIGFDEKLQAPEPHFSESDSLVRLKSRERSSDVVIEDPIEGTYKLPYEEVWLSTEPIKPSQANHHDHNVIALIQPPSDGKAAG